MFVCVLFKCVCVCFVMHCVMLSGCVVAVLCLYCDCACDVLNVRVCIVCD